MAGADGVQDTDVDEARSKRTSTVCKCSFDVYIEDEAKELGRAFTDEERELRRKTSDNAKE